MIYVAAFVALVLAVKFYFEAHGSSSVGCLMGFKYTEASSRRMAVYRSGTWDNEAHEWSVLLETVAPVEQVRLCPPLRFQKQMMKRERADEEPAIVVHLELNDDGSYSIPDDWQRRTSTYAGTPEKCARNDIVGTRLRQYALCLAIAVAVLLPFKPMVTLVCALVAASAIRINYPRKKKVANAALHTSTKQAFAVNSCVDLSPNEQVLAEIASKYACGPRGETDTTPFTVRRDAQSNTDTRPDAEDDTSQAEMDPSFETPDSTNSKSGKQADADAEIMTPVYRPDNRSSRTVAAKDPLGREPMLPARSQSKAESGPVTNRETEPPAKEPAQINSSSDESDEPIEACDVIPTVEGVGSSRLDDLVKRILTKWE